MKFSRLFFVCFVALMASVSLYAQDAPKTVLEKVQALEDGARYTLKFTANQTGRSICGLDAGTGNVFCSPSTVLSKPNECSDPDYSVSWLLEKHSFKYGYKAYNGETVYITIRNVANGKYLTNYYKDNYIHPDTIPCKFYIEPVPGDDTNTKAYIYCYRSDSDEKDALGNPKKWYLGEKDMVNWESNPLNFMKSPGLNCDFVLEEAPERAVVKSNDYAKDVIITGIESVEADEQVPAWRKGIYDIYGRKVTNPVNGTFYIIDGKKVIYRSL